MTPDLSLQMEAIGRAEDCILIPLSPFQVNDNNSLSSGQLMNNKHSFFVLEIIVPYINQFLLRPNSEREAETEDPFA